MMSHMCIDTSVRTAKKLRYDITLISDACTTKNLSWNNIEINHKYCTSSIHGITTEQFCRCKNTDKFLSNYHK